MLSGSWMTIASVATVTLSNTPCKNTGSVRMDVVVEADELVERRRSRSA